MGGRLLRLLSCFISYRRVKIFGLAAEIFNRHEIEWRITI